MIKKACFLTMWDCLFYLFIYLFSLHMHRKLEGSGAVFLKHDTPEGFYSCVYFLLVRKPKKLKTRQWFNPQIDGASTNQGANRVNSPTSTLKSNQLQAGIRGASLLTGSRVRHIHSTVFSFSLVWSQRLTVSCAPLGYVNVKYAL